MVAVAEEEPLCRWAEAVIPRFFVAARPVTLVDDASGDGLAVLAICAARCVLGAQEPVGALEVGVALFASINKLIKHSLGNDAFGLRSTLHSPIKC